jgi:hypothetical protein
LPFFPSFLSPWRSFESKRFMVVNPSTFRIRSPVLCGSFDTFLGQVPRFWIPQRHPHRHEIVGPVLDPDLAAVLLAFAFAGALGLPGLRKALRRGERYCVKCGRRILLGQRTCDCD